MITAIETCRLGFQCQFCGEEWVEDYEVRSTRFAGGTEIQSFYLHGAPIASPVQGARCTRCHTPGAPCRTFGRPRDR